jgi:hypothetical protein
MLQRADWVAVLVVGGLTALCAAAVPSHAEDATNSTTVIELFTSQGCSSCPPADQNLAELAKRRDIVALSFHVDYWDYIGWKDPFASAGNTQRQHAYAKALKQRYVYTPEMVIQGAVHGPGVKMAEVLAMIDKARQRKLVRLNPVLARGDDKGLLVTLPAGATDGATDVWLVTFDPQHRTKVKRGENSGSILTNTNVVRSCERLGAWTGTAASWTVPADRLQAAPAVAVLVQHEHAGPIIGAASLPPAEK